MSRLTLTASQRHRLERQLRQTKDAGVLQRTFAILEAAAGRPVVEIARLLRTSRVSVYHWLDRYGQTPDPSILADRRGGNHPSLWTEELQAALLATLERRPEQFGYQAVEWTVPLLCEHLEEWRGECLSETSVRRQLHDLGYVWKRPRYRLDPDPEREKKTSDSQGNCGLAATVGDPVRGRDRPAVVPAVARGLGLARATTRSADLRHERPARRLRHH